MSYENDEDDNTSPLINKKEKEKDEENSDKDNNDENDSKDEYQKQQQEIKKKNLENIIKKNKFTGKVFFVFFLQFIIIFIFIYYAFQNQTFNNLLQKNQKLFFISIILASIIMVASGHVKLFSVVPFNYFFFIIFTLSIALILCKVLILFSFRTIVILWTLLIFMLLSLSIYSLIIKYEIKILSTSIFLFCLLVIVSLLIKLFGNIPLTDTLFIILCLSVFNVYLLYDINSLIVENKITTRDYFLLNILIYFDVIMHCIKLVKFIYENIKSDEKDETFEALKDFTDDVEKGINEVKKFGGKKDDDKKKKGKKNDKKEKEKKKGKKNSDKKDKKMKKDDEDIKIDAKNIIENIFG